MITANSISSGLVALKMVKLKNRKRMAFFITIVVYIFFFFLIL